MRRLFDKKLWGISLCLMLLLSFVFLPAYADDYADMQKHSDNAEKYAQQKDKAQQDQDTYNKQIKDLEPQLDQKESEVGSLEAQVATAQQELDKINKDLSDAEKRLDAKNEILRKRLRLMYEQGNTSYLEILLDSKNFTDMVNRLEFLKKIADQDKELLNSVKAEKADIQLNKDKQVQATNDLQAKQQKTQSERDNLAGIKAQKEDLMKKAESDVKAYAKLEEEEAAKAAELSNLIRQRTGSGPYVGGRMAWPAPGYYTITSPFGMRLHPILKVYKLHTGIDIGAPMGANVVAAQSGTVIFAEYGWNGGYGNFVVIDHGGGISTAYAHLSAINVSVGSSVARGQSIGRVGSTGNSTGPHLHFEVRVNRGTYVDPMPYVKG